MKSSNLKDFIIDIFEKLTFYPILKYGGPEIRAEYDTNFYFEISMRAKSLNRPNTLFKILNQQSLTFTNCSHFKKSRGLIINVKPLYSDKLGLKIMLKFNLN